MQSSRLVGLVLVAANVAAAQTAPVKDWPLDTGSKVRVLSPALGPSFQSGYLMSKATDTLVIRPQKGAAFSVSTNQITTLQVVRGTHTNKAKYSLIGFVLGALGGAVIGAATYSPAKCTEGTFCIDLASRSFDTAAGAILLGGVGTLVGFVAGAVPKENWISVPLPTR